MLSVPVSVKKPRKVKASNKGKRKGIDYLSYDKDCGHTSDQYFVLKKQAAKLKATTRSTSNKDANYADLHTMINATIQKAVKPLNKKRKSNPSKDLQAFEEMSISSSSHNTGSHVSEDIYDSSSDTE